MLSFIIILAFAALGGLLRRAMGGWAADLYSFEVNIPLRSKPYKVERLPVMAAVFVLTFLLALVYGHGLEWAVGIGILSCLHFAASHAKDWEHPFSGANLARYSIIPATTALAIFFLTWQTDALLIALVGPLTALSYWVVQRPKVAAALARNPGKPNIQFISRKTAFIDGPFSYAEVATGGWWFLALGVFLA